MSTDPVFLLVPDDHPLAARAVVTLGDLADAEWFGVSGAGCFQRCFVTACARAGFTPGKVSEADRAACVDLVRAGHGVALVQPTFPDTPGVSVVPLAGAPLQWAHHVGWHDESARAAGRGHRRRRRRRARRGGEPEQPALRRLAGPGA